MAVAAVSPERRGIAIGLVAAAAEAGSVVGPLYGGAIIEWIGWRWIFWFDVPQSLILIALLAVLPNRPNPTAKMDYFGALMLGAALTVLTMALAQRSIFTGESVYPYLAVGAGLALVGVLVMAEEKGGTAPAGLLPVHLQGVRIRQHYPVPGGSRPESWDWSACHSWPPPSWRRNRW